MRDGGGGFGCGQHNYPTFFDLSGKLEKQAEAGCNNTFQITTGNHHFNDTFQECEWVKEVVRRKMKIVNGRVDLHRHHDHKPPENKNKNKKC
jgi:hypothetical protein